MDKGTMITLGVANSGERSFKIDELKLWEFKKMSYFSDSIVFEHDGTFYTMKKVDYNKHFK